MEEEGQEPTAEIVLLTKLKSGVVEPPSADDDDAGLDADTNESLREGSVDGQIPAGELDGVLSDMSVLIRYGHRDQVRHRLEELVREYPEDVLLLQRVVEFLGGDRDPEDRQMLEDPVT